jgi:two-component sensor histidine kinase
MLQEGDHRIKNSLQIIVGLLRLQARRENNLSAKEALEVAAGRVLSIASMHDALQSDHGEDCVDIGAMVETMCRSLQELAGNAKSVTVRVRAQPILGSVSLGQPVVLMINELVVNALRHAFPHDLPGVIEIDLRLDDGQLRVVVSDDGVGLPPGYTTAGFGMRLVRSLAEQIGGALQVDSVSGARFTVLAPIEKHGGRVRPVRTVASTLGEAVREVGGQ